LTGRPTLALVARQIRRAPTVQILFTLAILAAVTAVGMRRMRRTRLRRAAANRPGASPEQAIYIRSYGDIDAHLAARWCFCGGYLERTGEGTREIGGRRFRVARLACQECEAVEEVFFDTTDVLH
jgi:hypothetical protein